jgi:hypothetical protein
MGEVAADDTYTQDGTVDMKGNPAVKKGTGNWRACPYILGTLLLRSSASFSPSLFLTLMAWFSERVLREAGVLRHEHQPGQLHGVAAGPGERRGGEHRDQLVGDVLHHAAHRRLLRGRVHGQVLDHRLLHDHLHLGKQAPTYPFICSCFLRCRSRT